jgi:hypothetical protein
LSALCARAHSRAGQAANGGAARGSAASHAGCLSRLFLGYRVRWVQQLRQGADMAWHGMTLLVVDGGWLGTEADR